MLVEQVNPLSGSIGNALEVLIQVIFDTLINIDSINAGSFVLTQKGPVDVEHFFNVNEIAATMPVNGTFEFAAVDNGTKTQVTFNPSSPLQPNLEYQVILSTDIEDALGVHLSTIYAWKFSTGTGSVIEPPAAHSDIALSPYPQTTVTLLSNPRLSFEILAATPDDLATHRPITINTISLDFSKPIDPDSLTTAQIIVIAEAVDGDEEQNQAAGVLNAVITVDQNISNRLNIVIDLVATPLYVNNRITTTIRNLKAADGSFVSLPCVHSWTTTYFPRYATPVLVKVECGSFINGVPDDTINMGIYLGSIEADAIVPYDAIIDPKMQSYFSYCKKMYAKFWACSNLLTNSGAYGYKRRGKKLGELEVTQELSNLESLVDQFTAELQYYSQELLNLCYSPLKPQMAVKGTLDPDGLVTGRDFISQYSRTPILNSKAILPGSRRKRGIYRQPWGFYPSIERDFPYWP